MKIGTKIDLVIYRWLNAATRYPHSAIAIVMQWPRHENTHIYIGILTLVLMLRPDRFVVFHHFPLPLCNKQFDLVQVISIP